MRMLSRIRRLCFAAAALILLTALVLPAVAKAAPSDPDADRPIVWNGNAAASAIQGTADSKNGVLPVQQPFFAAFPDAASSWDNGTQYARASTYYPGPTGTGGLALLCDQALNQIFAPGRLPPSLDAPICKPPPKFPTVAQADSGTPDARVDGSQALGTGAPITIMATSAIAHADRASVYSDGVLGSVNVVGAPTTSSAALAFRRQAASILRGPAAAAAVTPQASDNSTLHIDSAVAHTKQIYDTDGALLVTASATLKGVSLAGGAIEIDAIKSTSSSRTDGRGIAVHDEHVRLEGVTVQGQPAAIDETGVHVGGSSTSAKPLTDALNGALGAMGAKITLASTTANVDSSNPKKVTSEVQGLTFYIERFVPLPNITDTYFATFTLGIAGTEAVAASDRGTAQGPEEGGIGGVSTPSETPSATPSSPSAAPSEIGAVPATAGSFSNSTTTRRPSARVLGRRGGGGVLGQLEADLIGATISHRFDLLYLAFAIAFVGVCLSSRLLVPRARRIS